MDKIEFIDKIKKAREQSKKRNFSQSFDLIINLKLIDLKKEGQKVDDFFVLPKPLGKKIKVCAFFDQQLLANARTVCDKVITKEEIPQLAKNKKELKKLADSYDFFIAQADLMVPVAATFGKILGGKGKMPNPKAGCVIPGNANIAAVYDKLQKTRRLITKNELAVKCMLGVEKNSDEDIAENAAAVYNRVVSLLPQGEGQIKKVSIKLTMGEPVRVK